MGLKFRRGSTAQQSGSLAFGEPYVNTTLGTLVVGGATGDIILSSTGTGSTGNFGAISGSGLDITGNANIAGNLTLGGAITIGDASSDTVNVVAALSSSLIPQTTNAFDLGSATKIWKDLYISTGSIKFVAGTTVVKELNLTTLTNLEAATGSSNVSIINLNTFSGSQLTKDNTLGTYTGSVETRFGTIGTLTGSNAIRLTNLESATASLIIETTNLETFSSSANTRFTEIGVVSGSLISSASAAKTTNDSQGVSITNINLTTASLNTSVTNLNTFTASQSTASLNTSVTNLNTYTSSLKTALSLSGADLTVLGNLTVQGDTTTLNTSNLLVEDKLIELAIGTTTSAGANGAGIYISGANASILWDDAASTLDINKAIDITGNITLTGNVDGVDVSVFNSNVNSTTASLNTSVSNLNTFSGSANTRFTEIGVVSGSLITSASAAKTTNDSQGVSITNINLTTASLNTSVTNLNLSSASQQVSIDNLNTFSGSVNTRFTTLQTYTASVDTRFTTLANVTSSLNASSASQQVSIDALNTFSGSENTKSTTLQTYTASVDTRFTTLATLTASYDGRFTTLGTYTGSVETRFGTLATLTGSNSVKLTNLESFSSSALTRLSALEVETSNLETFSSSALTRLSNLEGKDISITLTGDVTGTGTITDLANVSFATTIAANSVALGTDTTGNYMSDLTQGTGVTITHTPGEGSNATIAIGQSVATGASPTFAGLTINGAITATGDITAFYTSDKRHKNNIQLIPNALEKVSKLNGVTWEWNDDVHEVTKSTPKTGLIAQEVQEVLPQVVIERQDGFLALDYSKMMGLMVEAIKEQQIQIEELKAQIGSK